jgi:superfamily I DNA and/or RNA helicase
VGTVDSFQGQERDIIAISLTRSNPLGEIGFLADIRRMNVAMTRARRKLLLVGDSSTLCCHPFFVDLLAYVRRLGGYFEVGATNPVEQRLQGQFKPGPIHLSL